MLQKCSLVTVWVPVASPQEDENACFPFHGAEMGQWVLVIEPV